MSYSYERYDRRRQRGRVAPTSQRSGLAYWLPLTLTVTATVAGLAAWVWSERRDGEGGGDDYYDRKERRKRRDDRPQQPPPSSDPNLPPPPSQTLYEQRDTTTFESRENVDVRESESYGQAASDEGFMSRVSGAIRRTQSPQQWFDGASKRVAAGVAAAGAAVGKGLTAIREGGDDGNYQDHERWSEEANKQTLDTAVTAAGAVVAGAAASTATSARSITDRSQAPPRGRRRMVAVVVSAADGDQSMDDPSGYSADHASILSHIPATINTNTTQLVILIYAPHLLSHPLSPNTAPDPSTLRKQGRASSDASYSNVSTPAVETEQPTFTSQDGDAPVVNPPNALYTALTLRAQSLVEHPTHVLPFTTPSGHVHILRHLAPSLVYMQESLCGEGGEVVKQVSGWVGQVVVVIGSEGLGGGLVDTETEDEGQGKEKRGGSGDWKWWMDDTRVGLGKGVEVVEAMRMEEDWGKRVGS